VNEMELSGVDTECVVANCNDAPQTRLVDLLIMGTFMGLVQVGRVSGRGKAYNPKFGYPGEEIA
jgi:hypothetical protein